MPATFYLGLPADVIPVIRQVHSYIFSFDLIELLFQNLRPWLCADFGGFLMYSCVPWGSQQEASKMTNMSNTSMI